MGFLSASARTSRAVATGNPPVPLIHCWVVDKINGQLRLKPAYWREHQVTAALHCRTPVPKFNVEFDHEMSSHEVTKKMDALSDYMACPNIELRGRGGLPVATARVVLADVEGNPME